ncbi:hypothetical protein BDV95DRAFT_296211 [Massariosphaeria phaeospora]|uniref:Nephrocystin 3-like N-terminal domain-containing protein n=1 Tax=Massariosphaeria phaeospora TaxID=100035 RepID=A0A7C8IAF5_9PLEO|nr:hypothetical protein BDV95DRAFT_296211 [Massariosphaeria phaeospora]
MSSSKLDIGSVSGTQGAHNLVGNFGNVSIGAKEHLQDIRTKEFNACQQSLYLTDSYIDREALTRTKGRRVPGTCEWITQHPTYQYWLHGTGSSSLLWISGGPGKGKTMMSIFLTEELAKSPTANVIYYFCSAQDEKRNTTTGVLRSFVHQILRCMPEFLNHTQPFFESRERIQETLSSMETLWIIFQRMVTDVDLHPIYCVLDGLDECDEAGLRFLVVKIAGIFSPDIPSAAQTGFKLVIVSRHIHRLGGIHRCKKINLDIDNDDAVKNDVKQFIHARVLELSSLDGFNQEPHEHIQTTFIERAKGTFLWVGFAMTELVRQTTCSQVLTALDKLPVGLHAVYNQIILRIPKAHRATSFKILRWVTMAETPLSLEQLGSATGLMTSSAGLRKERNIRDGIAVSLLK